MLNAIRQPDPHNKFGKKWQKHLYVIEKEFIVLTEKLPYFSVIELSRLVRTDKTRKTQNYKDQNTK